jgi:hypothetical protein
MAWTVTAAAHNSKGGGGLPLSRAEVARRTLGRLTSGQGSPGAKGPTPKRLTQAGIGAKLAALTAKGRNWVKEQPSATKRTSRTRSGGW